MGGDGESSPAITGIDKVGFPMVLLGLRAEGGGPFCVGSVGGVTLYSSTRDSMFSSC